MNPYTNCATELCNALYAEQADENRSNFEQLVKPILEKHFPKSAPTASTDQLALMQNMLALLTGQKPAKKQGKRSGVVTMPKPTIAYKEIFDHAAFMKGVKDGSIHVENTLYKKGNNVGKPIPIGWTHFVSYNTPLWERIKDIPEVDAALTLRQNQYKTWRQLHPNAKSNKDASLYDQFLRDPNTPTFVVPAQATAVLAGQ